MAAEKATALVVRGTDWSETSRIATLFTREFGKVRALAKGGRRLRSNFEIAFDLLAVCDVVFLRKAHGGLDLLTEARQVERFPHLRTDLKALYAGYYTAELLADGTQDYDSHPPLYDAAVEFLRRLAPPSGPLSPASGGRGEGVTTSAVAPAPHSPRPSPPETGGEGTLDRPALLSAFELVWLRELGYSPRLDACAACGAELAPAVRVSFSASAGGVVCPRCLPADRRFLTAAAWAALRGLVAGEPGLPAGARAEVRQVLAQAVSYVLGRRPKMLGYLDGFGGSNGGSSWP